MPARLCRQGKQGGQRQSRVWRTHEGFTDQEGVHVVVAHQLNIARRQNAAFGDDDVASRDARPVRRL